MPTMPAPVTAPPAPRPIDVIGNLNLERELDPGFRPNPVFYDQIDNVASRIEMTTNGPIGYTLDGMKIDSHAARTFLDNKTRTDDLLRDPALAQAPRSIMTKSIQREALKNFVEYTERENASLPIPEGFRLGAKSAKKLGKLAIQGTEIVADTTVKIADKTSEAAKAAGQVSKAAMVRAKQAGERVALAAKQKAGEVRDSAKDWKDERVVRIGAFATGLNTDMPRVLELLSALKDTDKEFEEYDFDNARDATKRAAHQVIFHAAAARGAKNVVKRSWKNRKA